MVNATALMATDAEDIILAASRAVRVSKATGAIATAAWPRDSGKAVYRAGEWWWWAPTGIYHATGRFMPESPAGERIIDIDRRRLFVVTQDTIALTDDRPLARYTLDGRRLDEIIIDPEIVNREGEEPPHVLHASAASAIVFQQRLRSSRYVDVFMRYDSASRTTSLLACRRNVERTAVAADAHQIVWAEMTPQGQFVLMRLAY